MTDIVCGHCGKEPAACLGEYGEADGCNFACSICCAHGNEDGWCIPIADAPGWIDALDIQARSLVVDRDALRAELSRLEQECARLNATLALPGIAWALDMWSVGVNADAELSRLEQQHAEATTALIGARLERDALVANLRRIAAQVDLTDPRCPVGVAMSRAGCAGVEYGPDDSDAVLAKESP